MEGGRCGKRLQHPFKTLLSVCEKFDKNALVFKVNLTQVKEGTERVEFCGKVTGKAGEEHESLALKI